jgi:hypothetical protein
VTKLQAEEIAGLDSYKFMATIDKRVIHTGARVTALDVSPLMLERAYANVNAAHVAAPASPRQSRSSATS